MPMRHRFLRFRQRGFAMMEYCIVCGLVVMVLFANPNTPEQMVGAVRAFYRSLTFFISLP
jgi:Flp pilus assembly pilin Flp